MSFIELDHTADVLLRVWGGTLDEVFADAARAMFQIMYGTCDAGEIVRTVDLEAEDIDSLLHDFLSELLFLTDAENVVFCSFDVDVRGNRVSATLKGEAFDPAEHSGTIVKGVSYSGPGIVKGDEGYVLEILFDI
ncbi:MAG: archease [Methanomicrobiaceae archaeon]|uniref:Archease n=1 Tax=hydrocarbon metagenome TaxID=938273 RepID=A0A0W8FDU8_9ZZZZ|nr:archease [Methanomicrobiaceae archaeon]MDD5419346.1 archease [Methanomicrobiaceae archaeon]